MPNASATYQSRSARGYASSSAIVSGIDGLQVEAVDADLEAAQRLLQRFLERAADRHHLADRLHLRGQPVVGLLELLEREARHLGDDVIDRRLERRRHEVAVAAGDVVAQLVERIADGELRGDLRDRETRWPSTRARSCATRADSSR